MLRDASRPATHGSTIEVTSISFIKTPVYNEYSLKVSLKSLQNCGSNALLNEI
jgi:hypothetical protein